jgi:hypothetical protein
MRDYESMIDEKIAQLGNEIQAAKKKAEDQIERAMAEFIYHEALKEKYPSDAFPLEKLQAEQEAERYRKLTIVNQAKIAALETFKAKLEQPVIKSNLADELERLSSLTFPDNK